MHTQSTPRRELAVAAPSGYSLVDSILSFTDSNTLINAGSSVEFGSNMAISDDGTRIAVGAFANEASGTNVEQEGGVFIYDWDGTAWNYLTHVAGDVDQPIGKTLALSPDGELLALRVSTTNHRVYQIDSTLTQVGNDIDCASAFSTGVAFAQPTTSQTFLAAGCYNVDGAVKVLQYTKTASTWTTDDTITSLVGTTGTLFGFDLSWNDDATRLAIGEPNFDDTGVDNGRVLVYDFNGTDFTSFGTNIVGLDTSKLGFSLDLNADGTTLVIGSPNRDVGVDANENTGHVQGMLLLLLL